MPTANTFTKTGNKATKKISLPKEIFATEVANHALLKQVYDTHEANGRAATAKTKNRAAVRGGGRKPWRQKGTGNARAGSIRSPIWRGGGITFGPTGEQNYRKKVHSAARRKALVQALTLKAEADAVYVVEDVLPKDGKTKELNSFLDKLGIERSVAIVVDTPSVELRRASSNISRVTVLDQRYLNVKTVLDTDTLLVSKAALEKMTMRLGAQK